MPWKECKPMDERVRFSQPHSHMRMGKGIGYSDVQLLASAALDAGTKCHSSSNTHYAVASNDS